MKGGRRQGRQRKRWEDNIREWTGLEFGKCHRAVENREKGRKLVAKSPVVRQRPSHHYQMMIMMRNPSVDHLMDLVDSGQECTAV